MEMDAGRFRKLMLGLFALAIAVRLFGLNFDSGRNYHPDERRIAQAVLDITFEPLQLNPKFFAYGSFPFYVTKVTAAGLGVASKWIKGYDGVIRLARGLSGLFGALTVVVIGLLAARLYGRRTGVWTAGLLAVTVLHVQNSHYGVNDVALTFLVVVTLFFLVRWADDGKLASAALAGLFLGLSVATKFSALPLLLPLAVAALVRWRAEGRIARPLLGGAVAFAVAAAAAFAGQPYAVLDFAEWSRSVKEQSHMVRNAGALPYTNQYVGLPKGLYDLGQLMLWGMGPLLGIAALAGTGRKLARPLRLRGAEWVLVSWVVPYFLVTAAFDVKFPRYLLPIYPFLLMWGAAWLDEKASEGAPWRVVRAAVAGVSALYLVAFLSIYTRPFTPLQASEWVYENIPPGQKILSQTWDEGFPFHLPDRPPSLYTVENFPYYDEDSPTKMKKLARELATTDWIALQTKRLYGAVTQADEKFPLTSGYFYQLFAGDLGFELAKDFTNRPGLFGITLPDELADESFSVYDHPKVLLFRNVSRLPAAELEDRLLHGKPSWPISRRQMLLARAAPGAEAPAGASGAAGKAETRDRPEVQPTAKTGSYLRSSPLALLRCVILVQLLGLSGWLLLSRHLPARPGLYAFTKVLGVLLFAYLAWLLPSLGLLPFAPWALRVLAAVLLLLAYRAWRRGKVALPSQAELRITELVVWIPFLVFAFTRAMQPEIFWGEKPMDFSFLNALYRSGELPPPEPWMAGSFLSYTYFGHLLVAALGKCLGIHPALMFNLGIALSASLAAASVFAAGSILGRSHRVGALAVGLTLFLGNLAGVRETLARRVLNFDYFWATSRVIRDTINEFPLWSFLFADLHAHMLVFPFTVGFVAALLLWLSRDEAVRDVAELPPPTATPALLVLLAFLLGTVMVTNGWSTPTYVVLALFLLAVAFLTRRARGGILRLAGGFVGKVLVPTALLFGGGLLVYRPFWRHFTPPERNMGWEKDQLARSYDVLTIFGVFLVLLVPFLFLVWRRALTASGERPLATWHKVALGVVAGLLALTLVPLPGLGKVSGWHGSIRAFAILLTLFGLGATLHPRTPERYRLPAALTTFGLAVMAGCEFVWVWDRMNTIFKFYLEVWLLFGLAAAVVLHDLFMGALGGKLARRAWQGVAALAILVGLYTGVSGAIGILKLRRVPGPTFTLDGQAYLARHWPADRAAFEWLAANAPGIPVICEAWGPSYQDFSRVSMHTGLPIVVGWEYHLVQRGHTRAEIERRKADVETIYTSSSEADVKAALQRYHVALVYVGALERQTYRGGNLKSFQAWTKTFRPVYENPGVTIFAVRAAFTGAPVTTVERVIEERDPEDGGGGGDAEAQRQDAAGRLRQPRGIARDVHGNVYVCDFGNNRIQKVDAELKPLIAWGKRGKLPGEFQDPCGIAVGPDGNVFVADTWNGRVQVFDPEGNQLREWSGDFFGPRGIAVDAEGSVYVVDTGNGRVIRYSADGIKQVEWGGRGSEPGRMMEPVGIAVDTQGLVYVCDNGNARLQVFRRDGTFFAETKVPGWSREVYSEPYAAFGADGVTLWVTVPLRGEIRGFRDGKLVHTIQASQLPPGTLVKPIGILGLADGNLLVSDLENRLVKLAVP